MTHSLNPADAAEHHITPWINPGCSVRCVIGLLLVWSTTGISWAQQPAGSPKAPVPQFRYQFVSPDLPKLLQRNNAATHSETVHAEIPMALEAIENQIFGVHFSEESFNTRLDRIESVLFQQAPPHQTAAIRLQRIQEKLDSQLTSVTPDYKETRAVTPSHPTQNGGYSEISDSQMRLLSYMERHLFQQTYPGEPLETRLAHLEQAMYGSESKGLPASSRIRRLSYTMPLSTHGIRVIANPSRSTPSNTSGIPLP